MAIQRVLWMMSFWTKDVDLINCMLGRIAKKQTVNELIKKLLLYFPRQHEYVLNIKNCWICWGPWHTHRLTPMVPQHQGILIGTGQGLYFLRRLKSYGMGIRFLWIFYQSTLESTRLYKNWKGLSIKQLHFHLAFILTLLVSNDVFHH